MEISEVIFAEALKKINTSIKNDELDLLLKELEEIGINDFLIPQENVATLNNKIRALINRLLYFPLEDQIKIDNLTQIIATINPYLLSGINQIDLKKILIFLNVNCYLKIKLNKLILESNILPNNVSSISTVIEDNLKKFRLSIQTRPNIPFNEKELIEKADEGFYSNNIKGVYELVLAIERGGRGFYYNYLLDNLSMFLFEFDYPVFVRTMSTIKHPLTYVYFSKDLEKADLIKLANDIEVNNQWYLFELIRLLTKLDNKQEVDMEVAEAIKVALDKIRKNNDSFFSQANTFFHQSSSYNCALAYLTENFENTEQLNEIIDSFEFNEYDNNIEARNHFLNIFSEVATDISLNFLLEKLFVKWEFFFHSLEESDDFFSNNIIITDYANFIVSYFIVLSKDEDLIEEIEKQILQLIYIDSDWFKSKDKQTAIYRLRLSKLYLMSFAYKSKTLSNEAITQIALELNKNKILQKRFKEYPQSDSIKVIMDNLGI